MRANPPYLADASTRIRKVEFTGVYDLKQLMTAGADGIAETTWPGVYNRSRLPGRAIISSCPIGTRMWKAASPSRFCCRKSSNRIEFQGAAHGALHTSRLTGKEAARQASSG